MPMLDADNPAFTMGVSDTGVSAQMQVLDKHTGHLVATMEWLKSSQVFTFSLFDKDSGASKATFEIRQDGHAYIHNYKVMTEDTVSGLPTAPTADGDYKLHIASGVATWVTV